MLSLSNSQLKEVLGKLLQKAEKNGKIRTPQLIKANSVSIILNEIKFHKIKQGAIPNVVKSARESSCLPSFDFIFKALAMNPSKKSNAPPIKIKQIPVKKDKGGEAAIAILSVLIN